MKKYVLHALSDAKITAEYSRELKHKHGAVALKKGKVVSTGFNDRRTSWLQRTYAKKVGKPHNFYEHAEVSAIRQATDLDTLVVVRVSKSGNLLNSKPCKICMELIKDSGVKHLYYSNGTGISYEKI